VLDAVLREDQQWPLGPEAAVEESLADGAGGAMGLAIGEAAPGAAAVALRQEGALGRAVRPARQPLAEAARRRVQRHRRAQH
jgi:hypothetical protein